MTMEKLERVKDDLLISPTTVTSPDCSGFLEVTMEKLKRVKGDLPDQLLALRTIQSFCYRQPTQVKCRICKMFVLYECLGKMQRRQLQFHPHLALCINCSSTIPTSWVALFCFAFVRRWRAATIEGVRQAMPWRPLQQSGVQETSIMPSSKLRCRRSSTTTASPTRKRSWASSSSDSASLPPWSASASSCRWPPQGCSSHRLSE